MATFCVLALYLICLFVFGTGAEPPFHSLQCVDNDKKPVDWWFMYKPPKDPTGYFKDGTGFVYVTPDTGGRWVEAVVRVTDKHMLRYSLWPIINMDYKDNVAAVAYNSRSETEEYSGTMANGVMMSNLVGGLWLGHTLPKFPEKSVSWPQFTKSQLAEGHIFGCISMDRYGLNKLALAIDHMYPNITFYHMPNFMKIKTLLPNWRFDEDLITVKETNKNFELSFYTSGGAAVSVWARAPGFPDCPYTSFAQARGLVLDVYGNSSNEEITSICSDSFMVRNIEQISVKLPEQFVSYIDQNVDHSRFAVSTAAHWQRGGAAAEPWACLSNIDKDDHTNPGGLLLCLNAYIPWHALDNLKVSEPEC